MLPDFWNVLGDVLPETSGIKILIVVRNYGFVDHEELIPPLVTHPAGQ